MDSLLKKRSMAVVEFGRYEAETVPALVQRGECDRVNIERHAPHLFSDLPAGVCEVKVDLLAAGGCQLPRLGGEMITTIDVVGEIEPVDLVPQFSREIQEPFSRRHG